MTRDEEIEALAMQMMAEGFRPYRGDGSTMSDDALDEAYENCMDRALMVVDTRDRYRAARQPAPETPTPSSDLAALMAMMETYLVNPSAFASGPVIGMVERAYRLLKPQHAATLKERKEKADGA